MFNLRFHSEVSYTLQASKDTEISLYDSANSAGRNEGRSDSTKPAINALKYGVV